MRFGILTLCTLCLWLSAAAAHAEGPGSLTPLFANNNIKCIPVGINDLPAFKGNHAVNGTCSVTVVISGSVNDVSDFYFAEYQKRGWSVANRVETVNEIGFTAQKKKQLFSIKFTQVSAANTTIEFSY